MQQHTMETYRDVVGKRKVVQKLEEIIAMVEHSHHNFFQLIIDLYGYDLKDESEVKRK